MLFCFLKVPICSESFIGGLRMNPLRPLVPECASVSAPLRLQRCTGVEQSRSCFPWLSFESSTPRLQPWSLCPPELCTFLWATLPLHPGFTDASLSTLFSSHFKCSSPVPWEGHSSWWTCSTLSSFHCATSQISFHLTSTSVEICQGLCHLPLPKPFHKSPAVSPSSVLPWHLTWIIALGLCINVHVSPSRV